MSPSAEALKSFVQQCLTCVLYVAKVFSAEESRSDLTCLRLGKIINDRHQGRRGYDRKCCTLAKVLHMETDERRRNRLTINLRVSEYETLKRLSNVGGESMSSIVTGLVEAVSPALGRVADLGEAFNDSRDGVTDRLSELVKKNDEVMNLLLRASMTHFDHATGDILTEIEGSNPLPTNRGGGL